MLMLAGISGWIFYFMHLLSQMLNCEEDKFETVILSNNFETNYNNLKLNDYNFMPFFDIRAASGIEYEKFDILDSNYDNSDKTASVVFVNYIPFDYSKLK